MSKEKKTRLDYRALMWFPNGISDGLKRAGLNGKNINSLRSTSKMFRNALPVNRHKTLREMYLEIVKWDHYLNDLDELVNEQGIYRYIYQVTNVYTTQRNRKDRDLIYRVYLSILTDPEYSTSIIACRVAIRDLTLKLRGVGANNNSNNNGNGNRKNNISNEKFMQFVEEFKNLRENMEEAYENGNQFWRKMFSWVETLTTQKYPRVPVYIRKMFREIFINPNEGEFYSYYKNYIKHQKSPIRPLKNMLQF
jgi:hypothetical protein